MNRLLIVVVAFIAGIASAQDAPPVLRNNPFSRPPSDFVIEDRVSATPIEVAGEVPEVQATMIGSVNRLANVDGRILQVGDEINGYSIVEIHEQYAVFEREGRRTNVYVKPLFADEETGREK